MLAFVSPSFVALLAALAVNTTATPQPQPSATPSYLDDVVVTAQRRATARLGTTRQTFVLTAADLRLLGAATVGEALAFVPGATVERYGTAGHVQTALLRGATSTETLVLVNGRPANEPGVGVFDFSSLPAAAVDRIEVVEGAASTLWGSAAMGGVINIITKSPGVGAHGSAEAGIGFEGASWADVDAAAGDAAGDGVRVTASQLHAPPAFSYPAFLGTAGGTLANDDASVRDVFATVTRRIGAASAALHVGDDTSDAGEPGSLTFGAQSLLARQLRDFLRADVAVTAPLGSGEAAVDAYSDGQRLHYYDGTDDPALGISPYDTLAHIATRGFGIRDAVRHGAGVLTVGFDAKGDTAQFDQTFAGAPSSSPAADATSGWFASDEERLAGGLAATAAVRAERPQGFGATTVPSAGLLWRSPAGGFGLRANYGRAFRIPALEETSTFFFGTPALRPERAATFDVGAFDAGDSIEYFGERATDLIVSEPPAYVPLNVSEAEVRGIELEVRRPLGGHADLGVTYTDYLRATDLTNGARLPFRPTADGSARLTVMPSPDVVFGAMARYEGRRFADDPNMTALPQFASLSAFAAHRVGARTFATIRVDDLTGERVESVPGYPAIGTSASVSLTTTW